MLHAFVFVQLDLSRRFLPLCNIHTARQSLKLRDPSPPKKDRKMVMPKPSKATHGPLPRLTLCNSKKLKVGVRPETNTTPLPFDNADKYCMSCPCPAIRVPIHSFFPGKVPAPCGLKIDCHTMPYSPRLSNPRSCQKNL